MSKTSLVEAVKQFDLEHIPDHRGDTILHVALDRGFDVSFFKLLLKLGANPDAPGKDGRTVRETASRKRDKAYINAIAGG